MKLDIPEILKALAKNRPVFHSEADFQHSLAWQIREMHPGLHPRLEYPFERSENKACDVVLFQGGKMVMAIELKYPCQKLKYENKGEVFNLKYNSAPDSARHGTLKDIERMEKLLKEARKNKKRTTQASVITLTNDSVLWKGPKKGNVVDAEFNIAEFITQRNKRVENVVTGKLKWASKTSRNTERMYGNVKLFGSYKMKWQEYSRVEGKFGRFRYLHIPVQPPKS